MNPLEKPRRLWDGLFFLGLFLLMYCFYRYAHPLVLVSLDDWAYYGHARLAIPFPRFWNPSRVLPETLMPLAGSLGALLFGLCGDYVKAQVTSLALVFSLCIAGYVFCFYDLARKKLTLERPAAMLLSLGFLLLHFLIFRSQKSGNVHLFYETDVVCIFFYIIPALLNGALLMLDLAEDLLGELLKPGKLFRKALTVLALYLAVFSNLFGSVLFAAYVGVRLLAALIGAIRRKQPLADFLKEHLAALLVLASWLAAVIFEAMGGRAKASGGVGESLGSRFSQGLGWFGLLCRKMSPLFLGLLALGALFALILLLLRRRDREKHRSLLAPLALFGILAALCLVYLLLLGAVVDPPYLNQPGTDFPFFFFLPLGLCWCLGYALQRWKRLLLVLPVALLVLYTGIITPSRAFADYNSLGFSSKTCMEINYDLIDQVLRAEEEGLREVTLKTMDSGVGFDGWPHSTVYMGDVLADLFYRHGLVGEYIAIQMEPSQEFNEAHGLIFSK